MKPSAEHHYLSTSCYHGHHDRCRRLCKYCPALCECACHGLYPTMEVTGTVVSNPRPMSAEELGEPI